jgi:hypothetical protein
MAQHVDRVLTPHVPMTPEHLREAHYIGVMFIGLTTACVLLAAALLIVDSLLVWTTLGVTTMVAVVAYAISRTIGSPLMPTTSATGSSRS